MVAASLGFGAGVLGCTGVAVAIDSLAVPPAVGGAAVVPPVDGVPPAPSDPLPQEATTTAITIAVTAHPALIRDIDSPSTRSADSARYRDRGLVRVCRDTAYLSVHRISLMIRSSISARTATSTGMPRTSTATRTLSSTGGTRTSCRPAPTCTTAASTVRGRRTTSAEASGRYAEW